MNDIKVIFFDIDGTIYTHDIHVMIPSTLEAFKQLKANGYKVCIATSRCREEIANMPSAFHDFDFDGYIFNGGASIYDHNSLIDSHYIPSKVIYDLIALQKESDYNIRYSTDDGDYQQKRISQDYLDVFFYLYLNVPKIKPYQDDLVPSMNLHGTKEVLKKVEKVLKDVSYVYVADNVIEATPKGVGKHLGIETLAKHWGYNMEQVMVFGDGFNDISMLKAAGVSVSPANGEQEAKDAANYVCKDIRQDGVYLFLKEKGFI
ncbi:MAG: Cof-type HAD-IIB family hydrolase [Erysipelotrichaceae bacterium]